MSTSRRSFLKRLAAGAVGAALDPELLAWRPGARTFFLPGPIPGTYGALDRATYSFWHRHQTSATLDPSALAAAFRRAWENWPDGVPLVALTDPQTIVLTDRADVAGAERLMGLPLLADPAVPRDEL